MKKNELLDENLTLRKKVERLTTKNRSLEVLSDDLKSENKTLKSNLIRQEIQINSVVNVMKTKNDLLEAKDAMIETLKSQIKNLNQNTLIKTWCSFVVPGTDPRFVVRDF